VTSFLLVLIMGFAAALRIHALTAKSFWFDETVSVEIARLPWMQFLISLWHREANMALYYVLLHYWLRFGDSDAMIRGLSVIFSVATVPIIYALGSRLFGRNAGLLSAWLLAINLYHIRYAQEARSYALLVLMATVATWLLVRNLQERHSAHWGAYAAVCTLLVYSHFFGALVIVGHFVALCILQRTEVPWWHIVRGLRWFAVLMIPLAIFIVSTGVGPINWIPKTSPNTLVTLFVSLAGESGVRLALLVAVAVSSAVYAGVRLWRVEACSLRTWGFVLVFAWLLTPVLVVLAASEVQPIFEARYLIPCLPALVLIVAAGLTQSPRPALAYTLGVAITLHRDAVKSIAAKAGNTVTDGWGEAILYLRQHRYFTKQHESFVASLYTLLSDESVHPLTADREYARLLRNVTIEYGVMFLTALDKRGVKI
jgi:mannosyltransferase